VLEKAELVVVAKEMLKPLSSIVTQLSVKAAPKLSEWTEYV